ncbi:MAG: hypothetical protein J6Z00_01315 [Clostridia bacterium]|nr:hypothetical protein [Clostridia bacterium]
MAKRFLAIFLCLMILLACSLVAGATDYSVSSIDITISGDVITVQWGSSSPSGAYLQYVSVGGEACHVNAGNDDRGKVNCYATVDASEIKPGTHTVYAQFAWDGVDDTYAFNSIDITKEAKASDYTRSSVTIQGKQLSDRYLVYLYDSDGDPIEGCHLTVDIGQTKNALSGSTYSDGSVTIDTKGQPNGTKIVCHVSEQTIGYTIYEAASQTFTIKSSATTTKAKTTAKATTKIATTATTKKTTKEETSEDTSDVTTVAELPTLPSTDEETDITVPSYNVVTGATTTKAKGDTIYGNLSADSNILKLAELEINDFDKRGRVGVSKDHFEILSNTYGGILTGLVSTSKYPEVTKEMVNDAKKNNIDFSKCNVDKCKLLTFGLSLNFIQEDNFVLNVADISTLSTDDNTIILDFQIPVPDTMKDCKTFGIAMTGDGILTPLTLVEAKGGVIHFRTPSLGYYTLVGFQEGDNTASAGVSPLKILVFFLFVVGLLFLVAAGFFVYLFFIRPRIQEKEASILFGEDNEEDDIPPEEEEEDVEEELEEPEEEDVSIDQEEEDTVLPPVEEKSTKPRKKAKPDPFDYEDDPFYHLKDEPLNSRQYSVPQENVDDYNVDAILKDVFDKKGPSASETIENDGEDIFGLNNK